MLKQKFADLEDFTLAENLIIYALEIGPMELLPEGRLTKSGRVSPHFFNAGLFNTGKALKILASIYAKAIPRSWNFDVVYGPAYKGVALSTAIAIQLNRDVGWAFNRKEIKNHGEGGRIVGMPLFRKNVLLVDDVMTTGSSADEALEIIYAEGGTPIGCMVAFDREERGQYTDLSAIQEFQNRHGVEVRSVATLSDLIGLLEKTPIVDGDDFYGEMLEKILAYKAKYGCKSQPTT